MEQFKIVKSMNYREMLPMFIEAGLELKEDEPAPEGLLTCFEVIDISCKKRVGGGALVYDKEEYIMRTVAIEKKYQGQGLGRMLVNKIIEEARQRDAKRLILNAKLPEFYKRLGFVVIPKAEAPKISDCSSCPRYHNGCDSEIMQFIF